MFRGNVIGIGQHFVVIVTDNDLTIGVPGHPRVIGGWQDGQQPVDFLQSLARQLFGCGQQNRRAVGAMFGLSQQIGGADFRIHGFVGDHHGFGRTRKEINPDPPIKLTLGLSHKGIARPHQHIHRFDRLCPKGHGPNSLNPAQGIDLIRPGQVLSGDNCGGGFALKRRGAGHDTGHARNLGRQNRHMGRGQHRIFSARHITARVLHGDVFVAQNDAGKCLDLDILQGVFLDLGKVPHLVLGKLNIMQILRGHLGQAGVDFGGA